MRNRPMGRERPLPTNAAGRRRIPLSSSFPSSVVVVLEPHSLSLLPPGGFVYLALLTTDFAARRARLLGFSLGEGEEEEAAASVNKAPLCGAIKQGRRSRVGL